MFQMVRIAHQLLHALGMWHENQRWDRDEHVTMFTDRIFVLERGNAVRVPPSLMTTFGTDYDYGSVMHSHPYVSKLMVRHDIRCNSFCSCALKQVVLPIRSNATVP